MSDEKQPSTRHENQATATDGSVGIVYGDATIINKARAATLADDLDRIRAADVRPADPPQPPPIDPASPYPLFRPYRDPSIFAGRDADVAALRAQLADERPIVGVYAPSGYGKSSLLLAGLAPALRDAEHPVVVVRNPHDPGLAGRILAGLIAPAPPVEDDDPDRFLAWLRRAVESSPRPPVLVLDQFEAVFKAGDDEAPRARAALLIAATLRAGLPVRWVLSYRAEFDWDVGEWLDHAHEEVARRFPACAERLPKLGRQRITTYAVRPFGADAPDVAFREAIARPLERAQWTLADADRDRLTALFADARRGHWQWPLVPELQVVLGHRVEAATGRTLTAPDDLGADLRRALRAHIERVIDRLARLHFPKPAVGRALIGVALRRLVDEHGRRDEDGLERSELALIVGDDVLDALEGHRARLLMVRRDDAGVARYTLSHDTLAAEVATLGGEGWFGRLAEADREALRVVLGLDQRIGGLAALYRDENTAAALVLPRDDMARVAQHSAQLLWDKTRRDWWAAAVAHRRRRTRNAVALALAAVFAVAAVGYGIWWTDRQAKIDRAVAQVEAGNAVLRNLQDLIDLGEDDAEIDRLIDGAELEEVEDTPDDPVEGARARFIRRRLTGPVQPQTAEDFGRLIAGVEAGAHPEAPGRLSEGQRAELRAAIHAGLRARFGDDLPAIEWRPVEGGEFSMGDESGQYAKELPVRRVTLTSFELGRSEVTIGQYMAFEAEGYARNLRLQRAVANSVTRWGDAAADYPAWMVNWHEAQAFALWADPHGRLPTEAEWEFATRGGVHAPPKAQRYWAGSAESDLAAVGWYQGNSRGQPRPVCQPPQSAPTHPLGLCDVHGNLFEWVADWHSDSYPAGLAHAPLGPRRGALRVNRGGSFVDDALGARLAYRGGYPPGIRAPNLGFRLARSAPSSSIEP